ncbi:hypothetical protein ACGFX8_26370 [Streptomyces sp. NPDC048362]|uniref:hypothetical protein n=1 Tax=Streptomyces sp. NPDC048362 TaxID=3365539 RepID=UPI00371A8A83
MPRGRHRHSPPLHRLLPPSAIAGVSVVCALGPWAFSEAVVVRALAAAAAATAVAGAFVMRRWDTHAGKQVADLTRARASDEWRFEERVAELKADLEESRELRTKLEQRLRAKRAELAGLRNEHAALLRRYATAETERATALEGRRLLEIEAAVPSSSPELPPARGAEREALDAVSRGTGDTGDSQNPDAPEGEATAYAVFSAEGARLYRRALTALARFDADAPGREAPTAEATGVADAAEVERAVVGEEAEEAEGVEAAPVAKGEPTADGVTDTAGESAVADAEAAQAAQAPQVPQAAQAALDSEAARGGERSAEREHARVGAPGTAPAEPAGHFTVPTAVAVVPAAPARRPMVEGGFDFFGTQKGESKAALDAVQNEDLADVVGQEALAVHKAEAESEFKPADDRSRGVGQVIDLTAHDETEQIDIQGLRTAAS